MKKLLVALALLAFAAPSTARAQVIIKMATLAPEGSSWMRLFHEFAGKVETRTSGRVKFKFYAGGMQGDEMDCLRKIRLGQLSGAAITAIGLASIAPEARALEIARNYEELDGLRKILGDDIKAALATHGFVLGAWGDVGPVRIFSNRPIRSMDDMRATKMWLWAQDPVSKALFEQLKLHGVPMGVPDVLPGLSTGSIDAFFGAPLSTVALQWGTHAKYVSSMVVSQATGATVISKAVWDKLTPDDQKIMTEEAAAMQDKVIAQVRADNTKALDGMKKAGLEEVPTPKALQEELAHAGEAVARAAGKNVPAEFQAKVQKIVDDYRAKHPEAR